MVLTCGILAGCPLEDIIVTELRDASSHTVVKGVFPADAELVDDDRHIPDDTGRDFLNMIPDEEYKKAAQEIFMKGRNNLKRLNEICAIRSISILHKSDKTPFVPSGKVQMEVRPEYYFQILKDNPNYYTDFVVFQDKGGAMLERIPCTYDIETGILSFETTLPSKNHFSRPLTNDYFRNNFFVMPALRGRMVTAELYGSIWQVNADGNISDLAEASPDSPQRYTLDKFIPGPNAGKTFSPDEPEQYTGYNATVKLRAYSKYAAYNFRGWYIEKVDFEIKADDYYMHYYTHKARYETSYEDLIHDSVIEVHMTDYMSCVIVALFDCPAENLEKISLSSGESGLLDNSDEPLDDKIIHLTTEDKDRIDLTRINIHNYVNLDGVLVELNSYQPKDYLVNMIDDGGLSSWEIGTYTVTVNHPYNHELKASFTVEISEKLYDFTAGVVNQGSSVYGPDISYTNGYIEVDGQLYSDFNTYRAKLRKGEQVVVRAWIEVCELSYYEFFTGWYKAKNPVDSDILFHNYEYVFTAGESDYNEIYAAFVAFDTYDNCYLKAFIDEKDRDKGYLTISHPYDYDRPYDWTEEENVGFYFAKVFDPIYIDEYRVRLRAEANEGYRFVGWRNDRTEEIVSTDAVYEYYTTGGSYENLYLKAIFEFEEEPVLFSACVYANNLIGHLEVNGENVGDRYEQYLPKGKSVTVKAVLHGPLPAETVPVNKFHGWYPAPAPDEPFSTEHVLSKEFEYTFIAGESEYDRVVAFMQELFIYDVSVYNDEGGSLLQPHSTTGKTSLEIITVRDFEACVTAVPDEGYEFEGWYTQTEDGTIFISPNPEFKFVGGQTKYSSIYAVFVGKPVSFSAWVSGEAYIEVNGENVGSDYAVENLRRGQQLHVKAIPYEGFSFVGWFAYDENQQEVLVTEDPVYIFTAGESQYNNVFARTEREQTFSFGAWVSGNGYLEVNGENIGPDYFVEILRQGEQVTVKAIPAECFSFVGWFAYDENQQEVLVTEDPVYIFTAGESQYDRVFARLEEEPTFSFSAYANRDYGYLEVDGENVGELYAQEALPKGTSVTVKAVANQGYVFVCWNAIGPNQQSIVVTENPEYTFTAGESQYDRVFAVFEEEQTFSFSAWVSGNGYLEVNGENVGPDYFVENLRQGEQVTVKAIPAEGFRFVGWFAPYDENQQEVLVTENPEYTFTAGESQYGRVFARLEEEQTFSFSAWVSGNGYLEVNGENIGPDYAVRSLRQGEQVTVKAIPAEGFRFVGWFAYDGNQQEVPVTEDPEYTFTAGESPYNNVFARLEEEQAEQPEQNDLGKAFASDIRTMPAALKFDAVCLREKD